MRSKIYLIFIGFLLVICPISGKTQFIGPHIGIPNNHNTAAISGGGGIPAGAIQDDASHYIQDDAVHYLVAG